jgi:hypothetical protein
VQIAYFGNIGLQVKRILQGGAKNRPIGGVASVVRWWAGVEGLCH